MSATKQWKVAIKRAYEPPAPEDGERILVDRLWPRGVSKAHARLDLWLKDIAPSAELRAWSGDAGLRRARGRTQRRHRPARPAQRRALTRIWRGGRLHRQRGPERNRQRNGEGQPDQTGDAEEQVIKRQAAAERGQRREREQRADPQQRRAVA